MVKLIFLAITFMYFPYLSFADSHKPKTIITSPPTQSKNYCIPDSALIESRFVQERMILERQAERQYIQLKDTFDWTLKGIGLLVSLAIGGFFFFFGKTRREVKEVVDEVLNKEVENLVTKDIEPFRERLHQLQGEVAQLMSFKDRRVVWVTDTKENVDDTLAAFSVVGLARIEVISPPEPKDLNLGDCDLVIFSFDNTKRAKDLLRIIVEKLKGMGGAIHLIVYTFGDGVKPIRIDSDEMLLLADLKWFSMANFPSTMIAQVVSLVRGAISPLRG